MFECLLCGITGLTKKNDEGEIVLMDTPNPESIKLYTRLKTLCERIPLVLDLKGNTKIKRHKTEQGSTGSYYDFETKLGKRTIYFNVYSNSVIWFIYYDEFLPTGVRTLFELTVQKYKCEINVPKYKVGYNQITVEQINFAIKELEDYVNTLYDEYLFHKEYHEKQEKLLGDME